MSTALVTGGAGLIGAELVRQLLAEGRLRPHVFDLQSSALLSDVADRIEFTRGDLGELPHVLDVVQQTRPEVIYHLGGMLSMSAEANPAGAIRTNAIGTFNVLEAARLFQAPKVVFSSTIATYGSDIEGQTITDDTLQRPILLYGATKVFGEHLGLFYQRKYGIDFRGLRYPAIVGPGVKSYGIAQYNSHVIEQSALGRPYTMRVKPETRHAFLYVEDAARAMLELSNAPADQIKTINYVLAGVQPTPSAGELAAAVQRRLPKAEIRFEPDATAQAALDRLDCPRDDSRAREEWGWQPQFDAERTIDAFLAELSEHPERYP